MQQEFIKSEEISRSSRQSAIDLKEEYCRVVFSVAAERRRNQLHIEATKQEFMKDLANMNQRLNIVDEFLRELREVKAELRQSFISVQSTTARDLQTFKDTVTKQLDQLFTQSKTCTELCEMTEHQTRMVMQDTQKIRTDA